MAFKDFRIKNGIIANTAVFSNTTSNNLVLNTGGSTLAANSTNPLYISSSTIDPMVILDATGTRNNALWFSRSGTWQWAIYNDNATNGLNIGKNGGINPALNISSSGNIGVGTTPGTSKLAVLGNSSVFPVQVINNDYPSSYITLQFRGPGDSEAGNPTINMIDKNGYTTHLHASGGKLFISNNNTSDSPLATLHVNGSILSNSFSIGTSSPNAPLYVKKPNASMYGQICIDVTDITGDGWGQYSIVNTSIISDDKRLAYLVANSSSKDVNLCSNYGDLYLACPNGTNHVSGNSSVVVTVVSTDRIIANTSGVSINGNTSITGTTAITGDLRATGDITAYYGTTSDARLKTNIKIIPNALDKLSKVSGYLYNWNELGAELKDKQTSKREVGLLAQELEEVLPEVVATREDGYKGIHYDKVVALLVEAIKEQQKQIDELKKGK